MSKTSPENHQASSAQSPESNLDDLNFESAMQALQEIVTHMESDTLSLEEMLKSYERGMALSAVCQNALDEAALRIEQISESGKKLKAEPVKLDE